jgi:hypothetical protein
MCPNSTYWEAKLLLYGLEDGLGDGGRERKGGFEDLKFPTKPVENLLLHLHRVSVGDYLPMKGSRPPK